VISENAPAGKDGSLTRCPACTACGLPGHEARWCNRPQGVALRGYRLRIVPRAYGIGWNARGQRRGQRAGLEARYGREVLAKRKGG